MGIFLYFSIAALIPNSVWIFSCTIHPGKVCQMQTCLKWASWIRHFEPGSICHIEPGFKCYFKPGLIEPKFSMFIFIFMNITQVYVH